ncbi:unnamed protein product [Nyctereutes procyonoides]|uniref:(raccoon dog) hypothetical protein n=1 Tax=Nyctereutes procyonoides TaxID=34880 RepID=A0A811ZPR9_NYCPR|nr:unnamed protein product [Nyctereutes procyonoides]
MVYWIWTMTTYLSYIMFPRNPFLSCPCCSQRRTLFQGNWEIDVSSCSSFGVAILPSSVGRQKQLCMLAASAVPTAVLHCGIPGVIKYLGGCCRPLYHGQKCHVLRFGFHWVLVHVSRKLSFDCCLVMKHLLCTGDSENGSLCNFDEGWDDLLPLCGTVSQ